jgi:hypothetical protein
MGVVTGNPGLLGGFTYAGFTGKPINPAFTRAKVTRPEKIVSDFYLFLQQPFFKGSDISGFKRFHFAQWCTFEIKIFSPQRHNVTKGL